MTLLQAYTTANALATPSSATHRAGRRFFGWAVSRRGCDNMRPVCDGCAARALSNTNNLTSCNVIIACGTGVSILCMVSLSLSLNTQLSVDRVLGGLARPDRTEEISSPLLRRSFMAPCAGWGRWGSSMTALPAVSPVRPNCPVWPDARYMIPRVRYMPCSLTRVRLFPT